MNSNISVQLCLLSATIAALTICADSGAAFAQSTELVITQEQANFVKAATDRKLLEGGIDDKDIRNLNIDLQSDIEIKSEHSRDNNMPVIDLDARDNTDFTIGVLAQDTADGRTYRDPYSVDNIETNPIYPEGRYVDTMRASAGLGLSSEF